MSDALQLELLKQIVGRNPYGILVTDEQGRPLHCNQASLDLFGLKEPPLADYSIFADPVLRRAGFGELLERLRRGESIPPMEFWYNAHEVDPRVVAKEIYLKTTFFPILDQHGRLRHVVGVHEDTTARRQAERALQEARRKLEQRAAAALAESEDRYQMILDALSLGVTRAVQHPKPHCAHANQAAARIFGYDSIEEFVALPMSKRYANIRDRRHFLTLLVEKGSVRSHELRIRRKDGSTGVVSCTAKAYFDERGRIAYFDAIFEDITERRQVEQGLHLLSRAVEQSTEGIAVAGTDRRVMFANQAFAAMHGLSSDEVMGQPITIFHSPEQIPEAVDRVLKAVRRTGHFRGLVWHVRRDGTEFPTLQNISSLRDDSGRIIGYVGAALDVSDQVAAESEREMLANAVESAGEGIGILKSDGTFTYANTALARILGRHKPAEILGRQWQCFCEPVGADDHDAIDASLGKRARWTGRVLAGRLDGRDVPLAVTLVRATKAKGEDILIANVRDQSEEEAHLTQVRKLTLDAARALEEERARISRELHDQLGQTLTAINLNLAWLMSRSKNWDDGEKQRLLEVKAFVNQMLESVRSLSTGLRPPILDNRGLLEAVRSYALDFSRRAGIRCRVTANPPDLEVHDPLATILFRIFQEAMTNVARHSRASRCGIFLKLTDGNLELRVRDDGLGAVPRRLAGVQSLGIAGMRERAASVRGTLIVENRPEGGVCVTARLPWHQVEKRNDA